MSKNAFIIDAFGGVYEATPSHQQKIAALKKIDIIEFSNGWSQEEKTFFEYTLACKSKCLMVWDKEVCGLPNRAQIVALERLKLKGMYHGAMPFEKEERNIYLRKP